MVLAVPELYHSRTLSLWLRFSNFTAHIIIWKPVKIYDQPFLKKLSSSAVGLNNLHSCYLRGDIDNSLYITNLGECLSDFSIQNHLENFF